MRPRHYLWAGLDFAIDDSGTPVLLEANKSSHMLGEYLRFFGDERPFEQIANRMNEADGPACVLWRRDDPLPDADEDVCFITRHLDPFLTRPALIGNVEDNRDSDGLFLTRTGKRVRPGGLFRWWYDLPWSFERSGVLVINPNCLWVAVRDKLRCAQALAEAQRFRVPASFAVETPEEVEVLLEEHSSLFRAGYVIKPRVGWGGYGVQVAEPGERPRLFSGGRMLTERIRSPLRNGRFWDARVFVVDGVYLAGLRHTSPSPNTNFFQGGEPERLDDTTTAGLEHPALEAVRLLDASADSIHQSPVVESELIKVQY